MSLESCGKDKEKIKMANVESKMRKISDARIKVAKLKLTHSQVVALRKPRRQRCSFFDVGIETQRRGVRLYEAHSWSMLHKSMSSPCMRAKNTSPVGLRSSKASGHLLWATGGKVILEKQEPPTCPKCMLHGRESHS